MKTLVATVLLVAALALDGCSKEPQETVMYPADVGAKTDLFEVVAPNQLQLAPGVRFSVVKGHQGQSSGIVLLRQNGDIGGYMECGCIGATTGTCTTTNDNPNHPSCDGGCTDSEGNARGCMLFGPIVGPPKDPLKIRLMARPKK